MIPELFNRNHKNPSTPGGISVLSVWWAAVASSPPLVTTALAVIALTFAHSFFNAMAVAVGADFQYTTFLCHPSDLFADLIKVASSYPGPIPSDLDQRTPWEVRYFSNNPYGGVVALEQGKLTHFHLPPLATLLYLATRSALNFVHAPAIVSVFTLAWLLPLATVPWFLTRKRMVSFLATTAILVSYPVLMAITRGNVSAGLTGTFVVIAMLLSYHGRSQRVIIMLLALAINFRPNAALFLLLPLLGFPFVRAIRISVVAAALAGCLFGLSLYVAQWIYPDYTIGSFLQGLGIYYHGYVLGNSGLNYGSSGFGLVKVILAALEANFIGLESVNILISLWAMVILLLAVFLFLWNRLSGFVFAFLICSIYVLSGSTFSDYHLIVFWGTVMVYGTYSDTGKVILTPLDLIVLCVSVFLLVPKHYIFLNGLSAQVIINPYVLVIAVLSIFILVLGKAGVERHPSEPSAHTGSEQTS